MSGGGGGGGLGLFVIGKIWIITDTQGLVETLLLLVLSCAGSGVGRTDRGLVNVETLV